MTEGEAMKLAIYGTGVLGQYVYQQISTTPNSAYTVEVWAKTHKDSDNLCGLPIISGEDLKDYDVDAVVIAIQKREIAQEILLSLKRKNITECFFVHSAVLDLQLPILNESGLFNTYVQKWNSVMPVLPYLEFHVADACNLKCRGCSHFSNLVMEERYPRLSEFENSMQLLSEKFYNRFSIRNCRSS